MSEPFTTYEEVCEAAVDLQALKTSIEFDIINGAYPSRATIIELLTLAEELMTQLKFEFGP